MKLLRNSFWTRPFIYDSLANVLMLLTLLLKLTIEENPLNRLLTLRDKYVPCNEDYVTSLKNYWIST